MADSEGWKNDQHDFITPWRLGFVGTLHKEAYTDHIELGFRSRFGTNGTYNTIENILQCASYRSNIRTRAH